MSKPANWIEARLGKMCSIEIGGTPSRQISGYWDAEHTTQNIWVSIKDMNRRLILDTAEQISDAGVKHSNAKLQPEGTVLLSFKLTIGRVAEAGVPLYTNEAIAGLNPTKDLKPAYLYHGLQFWNLLQDVDQAIKGATLNKEKLKRIIISFPRLTCEQNKIAEILSTVDLTIEQTEALIAKLQRIKTGLMQDLFTRGIDKHGNLRSEDTHEFKDSPLGRIPVEWDVKEIQELLADVNRPMRSGPFGSALLKDELLESGIPLLGIDNVFPEAFVPFFKRFVAPQKAIQLKQFRVRPRDVMITIMGTVGRCCMVPDDIGEALSSKHVWTISFDEKIYSPYLACAQINYAPWVLNHFATNTQGGIMAAIRAETLRSTRLPGPPLDEMREIEDRLRAISTGICMNQAVLRKLMRLKTALMQDLLTGKVSVTPLMTKEEVSA